MKKLIRARAKIKVKEAYDPELIKVANKTSRTKGASALNADGSPRSIVLRYVMNTTDEDASILDFGAGKGAVQTLYLRDKGFTKVTAYDFGENIVKGLHDPWALTKKYQTVFASNVLNVAATPEMLVETLEEIWSCVKTGGRCVFNYPENPRKAGLLTQEVRQIIIDTIGIEPERVGGTKNAPIWEIYKL